VKRLRSSGGKLAMELQVAMNSPDPLITEHSSSLDGTAALAEPRNTGGGAPDGRSDLAEIFHPLGAQLLCDRSYAQTDEAFPYRISLALRH
jgi:hypothetical protein